MRVSNNIGGKLVSVTPKQRNAGRVETLFGNKQFMSVAMIKRMRKAELDDWLTMRGFMPEAFDNVKEKKQVLIEDLRSELNAG